MDFADSERINQDNEEFADSPPNNIPSVEEALQKDNEPVEEDTDDPEESMERKEEKPSLNIEHIKNLGAQLIVLKGNAVNQELAGKSKENQEKILENEGKRKLKEVGFILYEYMGEDIFNTSQGEPIFLQVNGQTGSVQRIVGIGENNSLKCEIKMLDNTTETLELPRNQVGLAQLESEKAKVLSLFSNSEQVVLTAYLESLHHTSDNKFTPSDELINAIENMTESINNQADELAKTNPEMREVMDLLRANKYEDLIREISKKDPEEAEKLKKLIDSGDIRLTGLLILMVLLGTISAMGKLTE